MTAPKRRQYIDEHGNNVRVHYVKGRSIDGPGDDVHVYFNEGDGQCARCRDGQCEQEVHVSSGWPRSMVVHDWPRGDA